MAHYESRAATECARGAPNGVLQGRAGKGHHFVKEGAPFQVDQNVMGVNSLHAAEHQLPDAVAIGPAYDT